MLIFFLAQYSNYSKYNKVLYIGYIYVYIYYLQHISLCVIRANELGVDSVIDLLLPFMLFCFRRDTRTFFQKKFCNDHYIVLHCVSLYIYKNYIASYTRVYNKYVQNNVQMNHVYWL